MNVQDITVDLSKKNVKPESVVLRQGDKSGTTLRVKVLDGGVDVSSLSGYTAKFVMKLPNNRFYYEVEGTISGGTVEFLIDENQAAVEVGVTNIAYVTLDNGETTKMSANSVRVEILPSALDGLTPPPEWTDPIDQFMEEQEERVDEVVARATEAAEAAEGVVLQDIPLMSSTVRGGAQLGDGLTIVDGKLTASGGGSYQLPTMSASTKGGAKVGSGLEVSSDALSVTPVTTTQIDDIVDDETVTGAGSLSATGLSYFWGKLKAWAQSAFAAISHTHSTSDITSGTLPVNKGGTGLESVGLNQLLAGSNSTNLKTIAQGNGALYSLSDSPRSLPRFGTLPIAQGGTAATTVEVSRTRFGSIPLGTCDSASDEYPKVVTGTGFETENTPYAGARIAVKFTNGFTRDLIMQIMLGDARYLVYVNGALTNASNPLTISSGAIAEFIYDGTVWHYLGSNVGTLGIANGGTGASTAADALTALGAASQADMDDAEQAIADNAADIATLRDSVSPSTESGWTVLRLGGNFVVAMRTYTTPSIVVDSPWGGLYYNSADPLTLPVTFSNVVCYRVHAMNNNVWAVGYFGAYPSAVGGNATGRFYLMSAAARSAEAYRLSIIVCGYV